MDTTTLVILIAVVVVAAVVVFAVLSARKRRTEQLRGDFGQEYDRTVDDLGDRKTAEQDLVARKQEHEELTLRPLSAAARERYTRSWTATQAKFVDAPELALTEADALVTQLLAERGYRTDDVQTRSRLLSVEHAHVMDNYRSAHEVEAASRTRQASTEAVRNAMLDFRRVFEEVLEDGGDPYPAGEWRSTPAEEPSPDSRR
jgi:hypothetical protein